MSEVNENTQAQAFLNWARSAAISLSIPAEDNDYNDLSFLPALIADKRVIAIGESAHYLHEWNRWRARVFKYLALHHGFSVFVLESGLVEGRRIHDYVAGRDVAWEDVVASITNAWGVWSELNDLIRWMREWNQDPDRSRELRFYCMDGTGNWYHAEHAYSAVHGYLREADTALADQLESDLSEAVHSINFDTRHGVEADQWRILIGSASLVVSKIQQARLAYMATTGSENYQWALRSAEVLRDVLLDLAQTELDFEIGLRQFWNVRDVSMAQSVRWIREREGFDAGVVIGAHNTHLQHHPVRVQRATSMGSYYSAQYGGDDLLFIGTASERSVKGDEPRPDCNQAVYAQVGPDCYFLDMRTAPTDGPVAQWLSVERPDRSNLRYQPVCAGAAWDCLIFHRTLRIGDVELPGYLQAKSARLSAEQLDAVIGRYEILGFLAALNTLDIYRRDDALVSNGRDDTSGELFPPFECDIWLGEDGKFRWHNWPAVIEFHTGERAGEVTIDMPGMGIYHGRRIGEPNIE